MALHHSLERIRKILFDADSPARRCGSGGKSALISLRDLTELYEDWRSLDDAARERYNADQKQEMTNKHQGWQPVSDEAKSGEDVQVWGDEGWTPEAHWCPNKEGWYQSSWDADWQSYMEGAIYGVTHWMPLPPPPEQEGGL